MQVAHTKGAFDQLVQRCQHQRDEWLTMVRTRLAQVYALAGDWERLRLLLAEPEQVRTVLVSEGALPALGVPPILGRWLSRADHTPGSPATVILNYGYWQRRFGGDRSVIGRTITVKASNHQPAHFHNAVGSCESQSVRSG